MVQFLHTCPVCAYRLFFSSPVKPIMKLPHFQMDDLVKVAPRSGVIPDGNDLIPDPALLMPAGRVPPQIETCLRLARYILRRTGPP